MMMFRGPSGVQRILIFALPPIRKFMNNLALTSSAANIPHFDVNTGKQSALDHDGLCGESRPATSLTRYGDEAKIFLPRKKRKVLVKC